MSFATGHYGLKQAPHAWYQELIKFLASLGFLTSRADSSLFILSRELCLIYFLVYVDDLIITGSDLAVVNSIIRRLNSVFSTKYLGLLSFFCGIEVIPKKIGAQLSQHKYIVDLLSKHNMLDSKPVSTPLAVAIQLTAHNGMPLVDATMYRQVVRGLQHLRMTRPDISFVVNKLSQFMHTPTKTNWGAVKRLLLGSDFLQQLH